MLIQNTPILRQWCGLRPHRESGARIEVDLTAPFDNKTTVIFGLFLVVITKQKQSVLADTQLRAQFRWLCDELGFRL